MIDQYIMIAAGAILITFGVITYKNHTGISSWGPAFLLIMFGLLFGVIGLVIAYADQQYPAELQDATSTALEEINHHNNATSIERYQIVQAACKINTLQPDRCTEGLFYLYKDRSTT